MGLFRFLLPACAAALLAAQPGADPPEIRARSFEYRPRPQYKLSAETRLVEVGVVVRDRLGRAVGGLSRNDFEIQDAGRKREITAFSVESSPAAASAPAVTAGGAPARLTPAPAAPRTPPRFLALVFDDVSMPGAEMSQAKTAARRFLRDGLTPSDRAGIFTTSQGQNLPFTTDAAKLNQAIDRLHISPRAPDSAGCPAMTPYDAYQIANHLDSSALEIKAVEALSCGACQGRARPMAGQTVVPKACSDVAQYRANAVWADVAETSRRTIGGIQDVVDYLAGMPGRRVLLLASSGFLSGTLEREQDELATRALRAGVVINALDAKGLYTADPIVAPRGAGVRSITRMQLLGTHAKDEGNDAMSFLAASTGGLFFHNNNDLDLGFRELGLAPEFLYSLGFAPDAPDRRYHGLRVRLKAARQYTVQARPGYYAVDSPAPPAPPPRRIDTELLAGGTLDDLPARITASSVRTPGGEPALRVVVRFDVPRLRFTNQDGVRIQKLTWIAALFDENANFVAGKEAEIDLRLKEDTFNRLAAGLSVDLTLSAPPGKYHLRGVVQDALEGKLAASAQAVEIQ